MKIKINRIYFLLILLGCIGQKTFAQQVKGQEAIDFSGGQSDIGIAFHAGINRYLSDLFSIRGDIFYELGSPYQFHYSNYGASLVMRYSIYSVNNILFFTPYAGLTLNVDKIANVNNSQNSQINYGLKAGLEGEVFLNNSFSFIVYFNQLELVHSLFGSQRYDFGGGFRFYLSN